MKMWITSLFIVAFICGCSTIPPNPAPDSEKYTFQVISIEIPTEAATDYPYQMTGENNLQLSAPDTEALIKHPKSKIVEYPIVIAGVGESAVNDQTKTISVPEDFEVVGGKAVIKEKNIKLGYMVSVRVDEVKDDLITYHLNTQFKERVGSDTYEIQKGIRVQIPCFEDRSVDTDISQKVNTWTTLGGLTEERSDGTKLNQMIVVRVIPPAAKR